MNLVLIGYRGSGKTSVGKALAERLGWSLVDTDAVIQDRAGMTIGEIYAARSEAGFRELETEVVADVARGDRLVISTGGGVVLRDQNVRALRQSGTLVYLAAPPEVLWERIVGDATRRTTRLPVDPNTGLGQVRQAVAAREPTYRAVCDLTVNTGDRAVAEIVDHILAQIELPSS